MRYPPYPSYRPSGLEWLGDVPENWTARRLKRMARIRYGLGEPPEYADDGIPFIRATDIKRGKVDLESVKRVAPADVPWSRRPQLAVDEILVVRSGAYAGDSAIVTGYVAGCIAGYDMVLTVHAADPRFVAWALLSKYLLEGQIHLERLRAAQPHLNAEELGSLVVLVPTLPEQRTIAGFLDHETAKIDTLTDKKLALMERLKEKRTALVSRTVTRGLPPGAARTAGLVSHPKLKPTGIDWFDAVPKHWQVIPVRHQFSNLDHRRLPLSAEERAGVEKVYPYYGASGIIDYVESYLFDEPLVLVAEDGANLLSRSSPLALLATGRYWVNNHAHVLRPRSGDIRYWAAVLQVYDYTPLISGAAQPKLTSERLGNIRLPCPPPNEQRAIADFLNRETAEIDELISKVEAAIESLQEYRTALITAAVTGKIDVRGAIT